MKILVLPGDGIGPEITAATLERARVPATRSRPRPEFETHDIGLATLAEPGTTLPDAVMARIPEVDGVHPRAGLALRLPAARRGRDQPLGRAAHGVRALRQHPALPVARTDLTVLRKPMDLVIVRENTEGFYSDRNMFAGTGEFMPDPDIALSIRKVTRQGLRAVARAAFELAREPPPEGHRGPQGQRAQALRRPVPARGPRRWPPSSPTSSSRS